MKNWILSGIYYYNRNWTFTLDISLQSHYTSQIRKQTNNRYLVFPSLCCFHCTQSHHRSTLLSPPFFIISSAPLSSIHFPFSISIPISLNALSFTITAEFEHHPILSRDLRLNFFISLRRRTWRCIIGINGVSVPRQLQNSRLHSRTGHRGWKCWSRASVSGPCFHQLQEWWSARRRSLGNLSHSS